jgi:hypothetical protein
MIRDLDSQEYFYLVTCADLECMVMATSPEDASCIGLKNILNKKGINTNLSLIISVDYINKHKNETFVFYTASVLNDLGHFKLAKDLESLSDFFLDKGENSH